MGDEREGAVAVELCANQEPGWRQHSPMGGKCGWFTANYYWSSSQNNANNAWAQNFDNGNQDNGNKYNNSLPVRPVRGFRHDT